MKIAITGHTSGLGLAFYNHFSKNHTVIGLSRSNGYNIATDQNKIVSMLTDCDLFFNNAYDGIYQGTLLARTCKKLPVITSGSMGADYCHINNPYYKHKKTIEVIHKKIAKTRQYPVLLLKMGYLENYQDRPHITYNEVISAVDFWLSNPRVTMIEFDNVIL